MEQQEERPRVTAIKGRIRSRFFMDVERLEEAAAGAGCQAEDHDTGGGEQFEHGPGMLGFPDGVAMKKTAALSASPGLSR
jgi:hypothetical protein